MNRRIFLASSTGISGGAFVSAIAGDSAEIEWGELQGRFVYDCEPPKPMQFEVTKDKGFVKEPLFDESLLVDQENHGLANVVVRLVAERSVQLPTHASHAEGSKKPVHAAIDGFTFRPHVVVVHTGQMLVLKMSDPVGHNPDWYAPRNPEFGKALNTSAKLTRVFYHAEPEPVRVDCRIHPWENAVLVITDHPYVRVSKVNGSFTLDHVPVGTWDFQLWHEQSRWLKGITIGGKKRNLSDGKLRIEIKPGENDLGEIKIEPKLMEKKR